ncbi:MAG TPA: MASE3 domain-containing protein, partial [bacterium]|nr:MASE3 domain-containing protein [bacterium]
MSRQDDLVRRYGSMALFVLTLGIIIATRLHSFLLFHSLAEIFIIAATLVICLVALNTRNFQDNPYFLFLGTGLFFVGLTHSLHLLAYEGMSVFTTGGSNLAAQLWIIARGIEGVTIFLAPFSLNFRFRLRYIFFGFLLLTTLLLASVFYWKVFPLCYVDGVGLTVFKIVAEGVVCVLTILASLALLLKRNLFCPRVLFLLLVSFALTLLAGVLFTLYINPYSGLNLLGHVLTIASFYLLYRAVVEFGLLTPYETMFRNLKHSETALRASEEELQTIFESASIMMVLADEHHCLRRINRSAETFSKKARSDVLDARPGEAFGCLGALENPQGCGYGALCETCILRNTVLDTFAKGTAHVRVQADVPFHGAGRSGTVSLLVSTSLLHISDRPMVLVCMEDISQLREVQREREKMIHDLQEAAAQIKTLSGLIPICSS